MKCIFFFLIIGTGFLFFYSGCEKEPEIPPTMVFKTATDYISNDVTVSVDTMLKVGIIADKTEDDLKLYNVSVAYDGTSTTSTVEDFTIPHSEITHYEKDVTLNVRNTAGTEKYFFTITDVDGNIVQLTLTTMVE